MRHFDQRTLAVLGAEVGAVPLLVLGLVSPSFIVPGRSWALLVIGVYTLISVAITAAVGRLSDGQFVILSFGGMLGIAGSALVIDDNGSAHAVLVLLAVIPALAAMDSSVSVIVGFVTTASILAATVVAIRAATPTALLVGGGAVIMAILIPTYMVWTLRQRLLVLVEQQSRLSITDPLTEALNRRGLLTQSHIVLNSCAGSDLMIGFLVADVDHFKKINDRHGHSAGDAILVQIAATLHACVPPGSLVARTGGEEFVILTAIAGNHEMYSLAERLRTRVAAATEVTLSMGAVCIDPDHATLRAVSTQALLDHLFRRADRCLYTAKREGRNRVQLDHGPVVEPTPAHVERFASYE
ncbi:GGDEF domain-containing protein [Gordonia sp. ABSL11-1]|uniref:GGDEF domain-containing protein n=1 Tax=Gordonia sp. ABSL11-1 TaxID=3053924 RepID=UPI0025727A15|nr:GGDEF domain-containing protein [Gordonia sp. ABSL11-1]MDL9946240.1 GGDEF domain-containing protein [Gordonia sp. ABSL11-1]